MCRIVKFPALLAVLQTQPNVILALPDIHLIVQYLLAKRLHLVQTTFAMFVPSAMFSMEVNVSNVIKLVEDVRRPIKIPVQVVWMVNICRDLPA